MALTPITPVLIIRNISKSDVNILGVKIRPGQQKDIYQELEYDENGSLTTTVLKELETPNGKIYRLWKVLDVIRIIQCVNPTHFGSGLTPDSITASNAYFEGAVLGYENGEFKWLSGGGGGGVSAVTASSPLASSGGSTPNLTIGGGTPGQVLTSDGGTSPTWEDLPAPPAADWTRTGTVLSPTTAGDTVSVEIPFGTAGLVVEESAAAFRTSVSPAVIALEDNLKRAELNANAASLTLKGDTAEAVAPAIVAQDETGSPYALDLQMLELAVNGDVGAAGQVLTSGGPGAAPTWTAASGDFAYDQEVFVAKNGSDVTGTGSVLNPFASVGAAMAAITDSSPSKRYAIRVEAGAYTESSALNIKPDVYIVGALKDAVRITAPSFGLDASFTGAGDKRSGVAQAILIGTCTFNMTSVTSNEGKLSFHGVSFNSPISITGFSGINQAQFDSCLFFGAISFSGVNVGSFVNNRCFTSISLSQHSSLPTILNAAGGFADSLTATAAVNNFSRRCSVFARSMKFDGTVTVDGPSAYFDYTVCSLPQAGPVSLNGGNLVSVDWGANKELSNLVFPTKVNNPIIPASTNATNHGDWGKQWAWSFAWLHASTGSDCYLVSYPSAFGAETDTGKNVYLVADAAGLAADIDGGGVGMYSSNASGTGDSGPIVAETGTAVDGYSGDITLTTGSVSGAGTRGIISLNGRHISANSTKIVNLADGTNPGDAVNKGQLDAFAPAAPADSIQFNNGSGGFGGSANLTWNDVDGALSVISDAATVTGPLVLSNSDGVFVETNSLEKRLSVVDPFGSTARVDIYNDNGIIAIDNEIKLSLSTAPSTNRLLSLSNDGSGNPEIKSVATTDGGATFNPDSLRISASEVDVNNVKIVNLADGTDPSDAANVGQLNVVSLNTSTNAVVAGEAVCADSAAARTVKKADVSALATARVIGIAVGDGKVQTAGIALAKFTSAPSIGDAAYLSATTGQLTGTAPGSGIEAEVGIVVDNVAVDGKYAVALQIKKPV